ncbi:hypothetical protein BHG00_09820 [Corynebacterium ulcerans]|nr:hypothetical protein BHG00_09820 [Corynebacterium ulcerans]
MTDRTLSPIRSWFMTSTMNIGRHAQYALTELNRFHKNARRGDVEAIMGSIVANGVYRPIYVNRGTYTGRPLEVLAGNHTLEAMRRLAEQNPDDPRWQTVDVWEVDVDDQRATKIVLADNRTAELGDYDTDALVALLETVDDDLDGTGYDYDDLSELLETTDGTLPGDEGNIDDGTDTSDDDDDSGQAATLSERFGVPPVTVINTRSGEWQGRKRAWTAKGIASFEGRRDKMIYTHGANLYSNWFDIKSKARKTHPDITDKEIAENYQDQLKPFTNGSGTSTFDPVLAELLLAWFSKRDDRVLDPWAGGSVRGIVSAAVGRQYVGHELRPEQVEENTNQWGTYDQTECAHPPQWITGDSRDTMRHHPAGAFDMIIGCPPYYDLETYSDDPSDLSTLTTEEFDEAMANTLRIADKALANDRFAAFVIGPVRDKHGALRDMKRCMINAAPTGWSYVNDMVLVNPMGTAQLRAARSFTSTRTLTRVHQDIVIFAKGDRKRAAERLGDVELVNFDTLDEEE